MPLTKIVVRRGRLRARTTDLGKRGSDMHDASPEPRKHLIMWPNGHIMSAFLNLQLLEGAPQIARTRNSPLFDTVFFEEQSGAIKHFLAHISPWFPSGDWIQKFVLLTNSLRFRDNPSDSLRLKRHAITSALSEETRQSGRRDLYLAPDPGAPRYLAVSNSASAGDLLKTGLSGSQLRLRFLARSAEL